jgi:signal transduction histidine kinase
MRSVMHGEMRTVIPGALHRAGAGWARPLHVRAALVTVPLLMALGTAMVLLLRHHSAEAALEAGQRMNLDLARYVVEHQPGSLLGPDGKPEPERMKALAEHVMAINPAVEVYLLDQSGRVLAHALEPAPAQNPVGALVDMAPMQRLLRAAAEQRARADVRLPVLGTDPREPGRSNTFTVAPVAGPGGKMGYLYIVLEGRKAQQAAASLSNSEALRAAALGAVLATLLAAVVLVIVWQQLTRPLRRLTAQVRAFRIEGEPMVAEGRGGHDGDEIGVLRRAVRAMQRRIAAQFVSLEDADRQRRELVSSISHDLRTPLSSIRGYVETVLLRDEALGPEQRAAHLRTALRHTELLGRRIADLFELSKLDAGRVLPRQEVFCLAELLQDVVQNYRLAAQQRGVALGLSAGSHAKARVRADIAMIERVLQNLIDNALRCTAAGGRVELAIEDRGAFLQISVSDTGRGIARQHLPHIFERYARVAEADAARSGRTATVDGVRAVEAVETLEAPEPAEVTEASSSGLGLAIVKRILDLHGSAVRVHSELKRGTRFEFLLPHAG